MTNLASSLAAASTDPAQSTAVLQAAIDDAASTSGLVIVPPGRHVIRTLFLRPGLTLELALGAVLSPDTDLDAYPVLEAGHNVDRQPFHLLVANGIDDVTIRGPGTIDGRGMSFWDEPLPGSPWYRAKPRRISPLLEIRDCRNVRLENFTIRDSPGWTVHCLDCDHVRVEGLVIENHLYGPNTDGLDINGCRHVFISNCRIHGCDDNIILKATEDARSCEHIVITNCILESTCAALGIGAETRSSIRHVAMSNCTVINSIRMIQIIMWDGGTVENVVISNVTGRAMTTIGTDRAIHLDIQQHHGENPELGKMRNIQISNVICETRGRILLTAQDGAYLENITLRDVRLIYPEVEDPTRTVAASTSQQLSNFSPEARLARAAVVADNVKNLVLANVAATWPSGRSKIEAPMHGLWTRNVPAAVIDCPHLTASEGECETHRAR